MSEVRANTISAANGTGPVTLTKQQAVKQSCNWNQTGTQQIVESFNTSNLNDNGTGRTELQYTSNMATTTYSISTSVGELTGGGNRAIGIRGSDQAPAVDKCAYFAFNSSGSGGDQDYCSASITGGSLA